MAKQKDTDDQEAAVSRGLGALASATIDNLRDSLAEFHEASRGGRLTEAKRHLSGAAATLAALGETVRRAGIDIEADVAEEREQVAAELSDAEALLSRLQAGEQKGE